VTRYELVDDSLRQALNQLLGVVLAVSPACVDETDTGLLEAAT